MYVGKCNINRRTVYYTESVAYKERRGRDEVCSERDVPCG